MLGQIVGRLNRAIVACGRRCSTRPIALDEPMVSGDEIATVGVDPI
jgi:hypothetical protein